MCSMFGGISQSSPNLPLSAADRRHVHHPLRRQIVESHPAHRAEIKRLAGNRRPGAWEPASVVRDYAVCGREGCEVFRPNASIAAAAMNDERLSRSFEAFGSRNVGPARTFAVALPRAMYVHARRALAQRGSGESRAVETESA